MAITLIILKLRVLSDKTIQTDECIFKNTTYAYDSSLHSSVDQVKKFLLFPKNWVKVVTFEMPFMLSIFFGR